MYIVKVKDKYVSCCEEEEKDSLTVTFHKERVYAKEFKNRGAALFLAIELNGVVERV